MEIILQSTLPDPLWGENANTGLPGISPLAMDDWLWVDDAFAGQLRRRDQLLDQQRSDVLATSPGASDAENELLDLIITALAMDPIYTVGRKNIRRPDGVLVPVDRHDPLATAARLVQEDLCIMQQRGDEYVLTAAALCFPAGWTLAEKLLRPLGAIHRPVRSYSADIARRVHRLFEGIKVGRPLWRANGFHYDDPELFAPFRESYPRPKISDAAQYFRVERQCLVKLPVSGAVIFSIHTFMVKYADLTVQQQQKIRHHFGV